MRNGLKYITFNLNRRVYGMNAIIAIAWKAALPLIVHLLGELLNHIAALTPEQQAADVAALNAKLGGNKKFEATSLSIIVAACKEYCQIAQI